MGTLSTHVLDTSLGRPAAGVAADLEAADGTVVGSGVTDADGRIPEIGDEVLGAGVYRLRFAIAEYHAAQGVAGFYPEVVVTFTVADPAEHYHVPVLLSPYGYSTYRGS